MSDEPITKILHLDQEADRLYLIGKLKEKNDPSIKPDEVEKSILFISHRLGVEWLTFYPLLGAEVAIKVAPKRSQALSFFTIVVPLGLALVALSELEKFSKLINKLNVQSNERISTILEALSAARYKQKGYKVELEPLTEYGRSADFRVGFHNEWIYFECKKEYPQESRYFKSMSNYVNCVIDEVLAKAEAKLPLDHRFDVILSKRAQENTINAMINKICEIIDNRDFDKWYELDGIKFAVNSRGTSLTLPPLHVRQAMVKVGPTPIKLSEENCHIQVIYNPFSNKDLQKVRRILKEAISQLPRASKSVIVLETAHPDRMITIAQEKLNDPRYSQIIDIIITGNGAWSVSNARYPNFPIDFLKIAVLPT